MQPFAWHSLQRALRSRELRVESLERIYGLLNTVTLDPEPIPLDIKVVLIGDRRLYYLLHAYDPEFREQFKVCADFETDVERHNSHLREYTRLLRRIIQEQGLLPFDAAAVARVIEHSTRLAGDRDKLSVHLRSVTELVCEASHWAAQQRRDTVGRDDVQQAIDKQDYRADRIRSRIQEAIARDVIRIATDGERVGQINGLSVLSLGNFAFGQPSRITARTRLGDGKLIDIERETELGGSLHSKGVMILASYLNSSYAQDMPLSMSASLVFEQSYGMVDGDSASLAELCALLSALAELPIRQQFAVTGSVNQLGEVQAIGGVNEKIEGFFDVCRERGLTGRQGVLIPRSNVRHLMLRQDVVAAAERGEFAVYAVGDVDEAFTLLTGVPAGNRGAGGAFPEASGNARVEQRLRELALQRRDFARRPDDARGNGANQP
jgi:lon-related putative ATP-dependent protease